MILEIKVIPNAKKNAIKKEAEKYKIYLTAPAIKGRANKKLIEFLAEYFHVRKSSISIKSGLHSRHKIVEINEM